MVTQITPINLVPGTMIPRANISQYDTGARVLKFQVYNGDSLFTFTNAMTVALVGTKPDGKGFSYEGTIASNMPTFDVTAQMSAVAGKVRAELVVFENGERCGSGNFVIFVEEGALGDGTDMSDSDYAIINDALEAAFDLDHFYADLQNMVTEAVEDIQVVQGQTVIDPTLTVSGAAADAKATGDMARNFLDALMTETTPTAAIATCDDAAGGLPLKKLTANIVPTQAGSGDPSPTNVRPISGYTGVTVTRTGINRFPFLNARSTSAKGVSVVCDGHGTITMQGTATANDYISLFFADTLIIPDSEIYKFCLLNTATSSESIFRFVNGSTIVDSWAPTIINREMNYTSMSGKAITGVRIYITNGSTYNMTMRPMFVPKTQTVDGYIPYEGQTIAVNFPSEAGTVYGGTLVVNSDGSGALTVDKAYYKPDASTTTGGINTGTNGNRSGVQIPGVTIAESTDNVICSMGVGDAQVNGNGAYWVVGHCALYKGSGNITYFRYIFPTTVTTAAAALQYLIDHNCEIVLPLATPTTYALSAAQVAQMLQGVNNVWMDANGTVQVTYYANTALYVDKKIAELQALVLENQ